MDGSKLVIYMMFFKKQCGITCDMYFLSSSLLCIVNI